jgi:hypothetical protein
MKFALFSLAIGAAAYTPVPICYGLDPKRSDGYGTKVSLGDTPTVEKCMEKCIAYDRPCSFVNWASSGSRKDACYGY